jgi:hypothetical protein
MANLPIGTVGPLEPVPSIEPLEPVVFDEAVLALKNPPQLQLSVTGNKRLMEEMQNNRIITAQGV